MLYNIYHLTNKWSVSFSSPQCSSIRTALCGQCVIVFPLHARQSVQHCMSSINVVPLLVCLHKDIWTLPMLASTDGFPKLVACTKVCQPYPCIHSWIERVGNTCMFDLISWFIIHHQMNEQVICQFYSIVWCMYVSCCYHKLNYHVCLFNIGQYMERFTSPFGYQSLDML